MPVQTIASNAGVQGSDVVDKLLGQDDPNLGYNAATGLITFLFFFFILSYH